MFTYRAVALGVIAAFVSCAAGAQTRARGTDTADQKEIYDYVLTMDKVQRIGNATMALQELSKKHPELNQSNSDSKTLDDTVTKFQSFPEAVAVLNKNGLAPREYVVGFFSILQAGMAVGFKKSGTYKEYPPNMLKLVSKQNLDFVDQHWDEVKKYTGMSTQEK